MNVPVLTSHRGRLLGHADLAGRGTQWSPYLLKLARQSACSCWSLIGPHSLRIRLAWKLWFERTIASYRALLRTFCRADQAPEASCESACGPFVTTSAALALISARAAGIVVIAVKKAAEKAKLIISLHFIFILIHSLTLKRLSMIVSR